MKILVIAMALAAALSQPARADSLDHAQTVLRYQHGDVGYRATVSAAFMGSSGDLVYGLSLYDQTSDKTSDVGRNTLLLGYQLSESVLVGLDITQRKYGATSTMGTFHLNYEAASFGLGLSFYEKFGDSTSTSTSLAVEARLSEALTAFGTASVDHAGNVDTFAALAFDGGNVEFDLATQHLGTSDKNVLLTGYYHFAPKWTAVGGIVHHSNVIDTTIASLGVDYAIAPNTVLRVIGSHFTDLDAGPSFGAELKWEMGKRHPFVAHRVEARRERMFNLAWGGF